MSDITQQSAAPKPQIPGSQRDEASPRVSVVVVSYFTGGALDRCLASLLAQDVMLELIIVDNGNPPDVTAGLMKMAQANLDIQVLSGHGNIGFAKGCNKGARLARSGILLFLNPDCEAPPGALRQLIDEGRRHKTSWMVGPRLVNEDGGEQRGARRQLLTPWSALAEGLKLYRLAPNHPSMARVNQHQEELPTEAAPVPMISGACMMLPAATYWALGGMDEKYFLHVEDVDFCFRFHKTGGVAYFVPHVAIQHHQGSSAVSSLFVEWHKAKGFWRYFWKNFRADASPLLLIAVSGAVLAQLIGRMLAAPFRN